MPPGDPPLPRHIPGVGPAAENRALIRRERPAPRFARPAALCDDSVTGEAATPAPDDPANAIYDAIEDQVEELRGLTATTPVARGVFDTAGLCAYLRTAFREDNPESLVRGTETLYKELGLMPGDASLEDLYLELLTSQVAGLYDDDTKHMYVVTQTGEIGPLEKITYAHEYNHALQDQAFTLDDVVGVLHHALVTSSLSGPVNAVAPNPVTNLEFTKTLGRVLNRPTVLPMPAFAARLAFGEMADGLLLASAQVMPRRLEASGYAFRHPALEAALRHVLRAQAS